eukprot:bmy_08559T0
MSPRQPVSLREVSYKPPTQLKSGQDYPETRSSRWPKPVEFGALRSPGDQETKSVWGGLGIKERSVGPKGPPFLSSPQGATVSLSETVEKWREYRRQCQRFLTEAPPPATGLFCNRTFDDYACWPDGPPGSFVNVSCPWYLPWASSVLQGHVYRFCTTDGLWLHKDNSSLPWRDLSECEESKRGDRNSPEQQLLSLYIIYTVGYALSFSALVIASAILLGFRHLHCTRNYIHLNLFASFILRALSVFIKDAALKWMYSMAAQQHQWDGLLSYQDSLGCRLVFLLMQYCVAANYYWLLVEGVYLYTLLALSVFSEQRIFRLYLSIGWGVPLLFVIPWGIVKYLYEDEGCWTRNSNMNYWLIIRLPILFAIGVNFLIFVRVICIVVSKLKANLMCKTDTKCRLAKSTLTLIPLLGTHEGLMVAILYCFVNNEWAAVCTQPPARPPAAKTPAPALPVVSLPAGQPSQTGKWALPPGTCGHIFSEEKRPVNLITVAGGEEKVIAAETRRISSC